MKDYTLRPDLPQENLAAVTNTLAQWLPGHADDSAVARWSVAEWEAAEWVVYWQNALPWLVARVNEAQIEVPAAVNGRLQALDAASRERTRCMLGACTEVLTAFRRAGIDAMPLKGAVLSPLYYPDSLQRPLADLDVLIRPQDVAASRAIMLGHLGYSYYSRSAEDEVYLRGERSSNIWAPDNVQPVEVHFALREEYAGIGYELADIMWRESGERPYWQHTTARIPHPASLLLHVCAHTTSDWLIQRGRLMQIDDIGKLCAHMQPEDWQAFSRMVQPNTARFIYPAFAFVNKYAPLTLPDFVAELLRENCSPALLSWLAQTELADVSESNPGSRSGLGLRIAQRLSRSRLDMLRFWLRSFFPRRFNLAKRYPRLVETPLWPLAYLLINLDRLRYMTLKFLPPGARR